MTRSKVSSLIYVNNDTYRSVIFDHFILKMIFIFYCKNNDFIYN